MNFNLTKELITNISIKLKKNELGVIKKMMAGYHPADIASIIHKLDSSNRNTLFQLFSSEKSAEILLELEDEVQNYILKNLSSKEIAEKLIENLESDDATNIISKLSLTKKKEVFSYIEDVDQAKNIKSLLTYDENSAGSLMAKELIKVNINWTVLRCVREMRKQTKNIDKVYSIYVVDDQNKLLGTLSLKKLLMADENEIIKQIYNSKIFYVLENINKEKVSIMIEKYDLVVIPVVDNLGRLIGRITIDDVVDVIKEEAIEDYNMASGISETVKSNDNIATITRARIPWLIIGLFGGIIGAEIIGFFDLKKNIELTFFTPLIAAMGGNVGVQSAAIIVQGLANNSIELESITKKLFKELLVALVNSTICCLLVVMITYLLGYPSNIYLTVSLSLMVVIIFASIFGTSIPLILHKYNIDPALATGPFITTVNDILGLYIYFLIGNYFLR
tara:strand:+ start:4849 stop:6195 length:1347 start_codon:yes stop_codon:yes gene_type:complete